MTKIRPSRVCPQCDDYIRKDRAPVYNEREYCCSDCAIDAYEDDERTDDDSPELDPGAP